MSQFINLIYKCLFIIIHNINYLNTPLTKVPYLISYDFDKISDKIKINDLTTYGFTKKRILCRIIDSFGCHNHNNEYIHKIFFIRSNFIKVLFLRQPNGKNHSNFNPIKLFHLTLSALCFYKEDIPNSQKVINKN